MEISLQLRKGTLHEASKDDNGSYLLDEGEKEVYLFDTISEDVAAILRKGKKCKSVDAVVVKPNKEKVFFIEFKNTRHAHMPKNELFYKAHDSVCTYLLAMESNISLEQLKEKAYYIVVYNDEVNVVDSEKSSASLEKLKNNLRVISKKESPLDRVQWELDQYEGKLFKKVYTVDKSDFIRLLKPMIWNLTSNI